MNETTTDKDLTTVLQATIRTIPDFPKPGIQFRDITPILQTPVVFQRVIDAMAEYTQGLGADVVVGIESRGFVFGAPVALKLDLPFVLARKPGKLPYKTRGVEYALEYGTDRIEMHVDAVQDGQKVVIVDDLLATGGTAGAASRLVESLGGRVAGLAFVVELPALNGRKALAKYDVYSQVTFEGD